MTDRRGSAIPASVPEPGDGEQDDPDRSDAREELEIGARWGPEGQPLKDEQAAEEHHQEGSAPRAPPAGWHPGQYATH